MPGVDKPEDKELDPAVVTLWRIQLGVLAAAVGLIALAVVGLTAIAGGPVAVIGAVATLVASPVVVLAVRLPRLRYRHWRYRLGPEALELRHGAVFRERSVVPYFRVQHADISSGPLERRLGLVRLKLRTASSGTDGEIPGLTEAAALAAQKRILERAGSVTGL